MWKYIAVLVFSVLTSNLSAQSFNCSGPDCGSIQKNYIDYFHAFNTVFMPTQLRSTLAASAMAANNQPTGVTMRKFSIGVSANVSVADKESVYLYNTAYPSVYKKV